MRIKHHQLFNKFIVIIMSLIVTFYSLFGTCLNVLAEDADEAYVARTTSDLNVRSLPTTNANPDGSSNKIGEFADGSLITVLSKKKIAGAGCNEGWVKAIQGTLTGYVCSKYIVDATVDAYDRPWTTPKKAIIGGAKFISRSYIAKGQFTSYLKKFNVNPNAYYKMYNHQYMANLQAPSSEASTSYNTYLKNNLLALPLEFSIPVFLNMLERYDRPGSNLAEIKVLDEVKDPEFEAKLDEQKFPESYKRILRALHVDHPNWVFKAMHTNADFGTSVAVEKTVSSIQGGDIYYDLSSGSRKQTETGWYIANDATVAYFLDPRNFLTDKYILQFESLQYSENFTESIVQTVLQGTFMAEYSLIDNQTYASIFIEAGKTADISAVYLAALARQESGVKGGSTTNGAEFVYNNVTYSGLFNFFNIGAYSSESNPAKAGLVYASGGYCTKCSVNFVPEIPTIDPEEIKKASEAQTIINNLGLKVKDNNIVGITPGTTATQLREKNSSIKVSQEQIGTGTVIEFSNGIKYTVIIYGDLTGDGAINSADLLRLRKHLLGTDPLSGVYADSSNVVADTEVNSADLLRLRQYLIGIASIEQK